MSVSENYLRNLARGVRHGEAANQAIIEDLFDKIKVLREAKNAAVLCLERASKFVLCAPGCEGRCPKGCPDDHIREALAHLKSTDGPRG
jgi:hypothetical protein